MIGEGDLPSNTCIQNCRLLSLSPVMIVAEYLERVHHFIMSCHSWSPLLESWESSHIREMRKPNRSSVNHELVTGLVSQVLKWHIYCLATQKAHLLVVYIISNIVSGTFRYRFDWVSTVHFKWFDGGSGCWVHVARCERRALQWCVTFSSWLILARRIVSLLNLKYNLTWWHVFHASYQITLQKQGWVKNCKWGKCFYPIFYAFVCSLHNFQVNEV